jgi:hypothetical protein
MARVDGSALRTLGLALLGVGVGVTLARVVLVASATWSPGGAFPGDIVVRGGRRTIVVPIATSIVLPVPATLLLDAFLRR